MRIHLCRADKWADTRTSKCRIVECGGSTNDIEWIFLDVCCTVEELMTIQKNIHHQVEAVTWEKKKLGQKNFVHEKKISEEGYLGIGQFRNNSKKQKDSNCEESGMGRF